MCAQSVFLKYRGHNPWSFKLVLLLVCRFLLSLRSYSGHTNVVFQNIPEIRRDYLGVADITPVEIPKIPTETPGNNFFLIVNAGYWRRSVFQLVITFNIFLNNLTNCVYVYPHVYLFYSFRFIIYMRYFAEWLTN